MNYNMDINVHCIQFIFHLIQHKRTLFEKHMPCEIVLINTKKNVNVDIRTNKPLEFRLRLSCSVSIQN